MNKQIVHWFDRTFYPHSPDLWDDKYLRSVILKYLSKDHHILDIGAGRGRILEMDFKSLASYVEGVDPDERVIDNPLLHKGHIGLGDDMPFFDDNTFDIVFSDNVLEHVANPEILFKEVSRVLKPDGLFINKTPNKWHYMPLIARVTPLRFHRYINKIRGREENDTFPTLYKANTRRDQSKFANLSNLSVEEFILVEQRPQYLRMTFFTYPFGLFYERFVNFFGIHGVKSILVSVLRKRS